MNGKSYILTLAMTVLVPLAALAQFGQLSPLHVNGDRLEDEQGNRVVLHGVMDTPNPYFNSGRWGSSASTAYVNKCIDYFDQLYTAITDTSQGACCNVFRLHLDPCWCFVNSTGEDNYEAFSFSRFKQFWEKLYWPLIEKALGHGLYVVVRPPGVCPRNISVDGGYHNYLKQVWEYVAADDSIRKYAGYVSLELANEPVNIEGGNASAKPYEFFQPLCDIIRQQGFTGIIWVPGMGYQSIYNSYEQHPIEGYNIGYAVHCYPGWYGGSDDECEPETYIANFEAQVPVVKTSPVIITEIDWSPEKEGEGKYNEFGEWVAANYGTWGTATTSRWGTAYKALIDRYHISMTLTGTGDYIDIDQYLADKTVISAFQGQAEACGEACMAWYRDYAQTDFAYKPFERTRYADQGDGTYMNPIINADFPDPDLLRVGDTFYMLSTTMFHVPGATILKSHDLVNWEYCANPLQQLADNDKHNLLNGQNAYGGGMWASALNYRNGTYYLLAQCNDAGTYLLTATDVEGQWTSRRLSESYYDCGLLFDGDDTYVVSGINHLTVTRLDQQFNRLSSKEVIVRDNSGLEGSRFYRIGDYYYIYSTYGGTEGSQTIFRSTTPMGNYEECSDRLMKGQNIHQGALVDTPTGEWWTILFKDDGAIGRVPYLEPVSWNEGWPTIGNDGTDVSKGGMAYRKPDVGGAWPRTSLPTNDTFTGLTLGRQWQWNHQPDGNAWSLIENPGSLRLYTTGTANDLKQARNSLTQRMVALHNTGASNASKPQVYGTVKMDIAQMQDGDVAGLAVFQDPYSWIGIKAVNGERHLYVYREAYDQTEAFLKDCGILTADVVYLQARANFGTGKVAYYYSTDNANYERAVSNTFDMRYRLSVFVGQRFYLFNYATRQNGGFVDIDWFTTEADFSEEAFYSPESLQTFSPEDLQVVGIEAPETLTMLNGGTATLPLVAVMQSGRQQDIATQCEYTVEDAGLISINRGTVTGHGEGQTTVIATYTDYQGEKYELSIPVSVETFPLVEGLFNPSLSGTGSFDPVTLQFTTGSKGMAGWNYKAGLDISSAQYIVIELEEKPAVSTSLCIYDRSSSYTRTLTSATTKLKLSNASKIDLSAVTRICFQTGGGKPIKMKRIFLSQDGETPTGIEVVESERLRVGELCSGMRLKVDGSVYDLQGRHVSDGNLPGSQMRKGIYIVGGKKIVVK